MVDDIDVAVDEPAVEGVDGAADDHEVEREDVAHDAFGAAGEGEEEFDVLADVQDVDLPFALEIRIWKFRNLGVTSTALSDLLSILSRRVPEAQFPRDPRTLMDTPNVSVKDIDGWVVYIRHLAEMLISIRKTAGAHERPTELILSADGVQMHQFHSSKTCWPLMARVFNSDQPPVLLALSYGQGKPPMAYFEDALAALAPAVHEEDIVVRGVCCDLPARSTLQAVVGHGSKSACPFCTAIAESLPRGNGHIRVFRDQG